MVKFLIAIFIAISVIDFYLLAIYFYPEIIEWLKYNSGIGSIVGGTIGALGSALSICLMLAWQRDEESSRITSAIYIEVMEFTKIAVEILNLCIEIFLGKKNKNAMEFYIETLPQSPTIFISCADRIALFHSPATIVSFYNIFRKIEVITKPEAANKLGQTEQNLGIRKEIVGNVAQELIKICELGRDALNKWSPKSEFERDANKETLQKVLSTLENANKIFPKNTINRPV